MKLPSPAQIRLAGTVLGRAHMALLTLKSNLETLIALEGKPGRVSDAVAHRAMLKDVERTLKLWDEEDS